MRLLEAEDKPVRLQMGRSNLRAALDGDFIFTSKLVDGRFPDWRRVIPAKRQGPDRRSRGSAPGVCPCRHPSNEKFRGVRLNLRENLLRITANNPEQEEARRAA